MVGKGSRFLLISSTKVMPCALISCILQHADTILMANLSTTKIRHWTPELPVFFCLMTSFIISEKIDRWLIFLYYNMMTLNKFLFYSILINFIILIFNINFLESENQSIIILFRSIIFISIWFIKMQ